MSTQDSNEIDIQKLAQLARIEVDVKQAAELEASIKNILGFVSTIQEADVPEVAPIDRFRLVQNRLRMDDKSDEVGKYQDEIIGEFPKQKGGYIQVPKMINREAKDSN